ncbi:hypothetical protein Bca52824_026318 [Brassica carinata]|uniref:Uncharacterized protein n=1 Tax=Brassica carinata TaxID=52824 RepID=A0A8X7V7T1_BRACI|nr:hypothetical protein Bca52824_026318 [Brassica carinata]
MQHRMEPRSSSCVIRRIDISHLRGNEFSSIGTVSITSSSASTYANVAASKEIRNNELKSSLSRNSLAPSKNSRNELILGAMA